MPLQLSKVSIQLLQFFLRGWYRQVWNPPGTPPNKTTGAATLVEQCRQIKAVNPNTRCFVYRNTELALEWLEPQRAVMNDPAFAGTYLVETHSHGQHWHLVAWFS